MVVHCCFCCCNENLGTNSLHFFKSSSHLKQFLALSVCSDTGAGFWHVSHFLVPIYLLRSYMYCATYQEVQLPLQFSWSSSIDPSCWMVASSKLFRNLIWVHRNSPSSTFFVRVICAILACVCSIEKSLNLNEASVSNYHYPFSEMFSPPFARVITYRLGRTRSIAFSKPFHHHGTETAMVCALYRAHFSIIYDACESTCSPEPVFGRDLDDFCDSSCALCLDEAWALIYQAKRSYP